MNEQDEFDDELIGEESEAVEYADGDEDGEDDTDDDESAEFRSALLAKHEMIALISLRTVEGGGRIVRIDPRQSLPSAKSYDDPADALRWFRRSLATSRRNGWRVVYDGEPLFG